MNLMYSQIGYDARYQNQLILHVTEKADSLNLRIRHRESKQEWSFAAEPWGEKWGGFWLTAELPPDLPVGTYRVLEPSEEDTDHLFSVGQNILREKSWYPVSLLQAEVRERVCKTKPGWRDCGSWLQEANSQAVYLWGLIDYYESRQDLLNDDQRKRYLHQIENGCSALASYQDLGSKIDNKPGGLIHEVNAQPDIIIRNDVIKAAYAFVRAAALNINNRTWRKRAIDAYRFSKTAPFFRPESIETLAHGAPADYVPQADDFQTCDLFMMGAVAFELARSDPQYVEEAVQWFERALKRQVPKEQAEAGYYGHFKAFADSTFSENVWTHHGISGDTGQTFAFYYFPLIQAVKQWNDHPGAPQWRKALWDFTTGYFIPACQQNPFQLCPLGVFGEEGLISFAGLWHGMNAVYGFAAALALELADLFPEREKDLHKIATGNLQWIAGLNTGLTKQRMETGCTFCWEDLEEDRAIPVSMIHSVGRKWGGSWTTIPGSITNGFSSGEQFTFDVDVTQAMDAPNSFTDEDWITHAGGWLYGIARY